MINDLTGTRISYYEIIRPLGEGGMGSVYLAEDKMLDRRIAIKVLNPLLTQDKLFVQRFRQEAKVQSTLHHPSIVTLFTFFEENGNYCIAMEYAEGETLKELIKKTGPMSEKLVANIFRQLRDGLQYAHRKGVIHRDIKPGNILIDAKGNIKIMDFGIAKIIGDMNLTKTGMKMGTIYYMSPEQVRAEKDIDYRTDIFSMGITLYEMLTGQLPYNANTESDYEIMKEIVERDIKDPRSIYPYISDIWIEIIYSMIEKDKTRRIIKHVPELFFSDKYAAGIPNTDKNDSDELKKENKEYYCRVCSRRLSGNYNFCPYCGSNIKEEVEESKDQEEEKWVCDNCSYPVSKDSVYCPQCGASFEGSVSNEENIEASNHSIDTNLIYLIIAVIVIVLYILVKK